MPARPNSANRRGGRTTPKGTRPSGPSAAAHHDRSTAPVDRPSFGHDPARGSKGPAFRAAPTRSGTRGNR